MAQRTNSRLIPLIVSISGLAIAGSFAVMRLTAGAPAPEQTVEPSSQTDAASHVRYMVPVSSSQPARGQSNALVTIVTWCELRGPACAALDKPMEALLAKYQGEVRWVFRQLPDTKRKDAALVHYFARGAHLQGAKFWDVRRELAAIDPQRELSEQDLEGIANKLGLNWSALQSGIRDNAFTQYVGVDLVFARKFGVDRTPYLFVNGRPVSAARAEELVARLEPLIFEERESAKQLLHSGVSPDKLYSKIIEDGLWSVGDDPKARQDARAAADKSKAQGQ